MPDSTLSSEERREGGLEQFTEYGDLLVHVLAHTGVSIRFLESFLQTLQGFSKLRPQQSRGPRSASALLPMNFRSQA